MKSPARGLSRHKTVEKGTMSDSELELQDQTPPTNQLVTQSSPSKVEVKVKAAPRTLECIASNSKQSTKSLKALEYLRLSKFCFSAKELHEEYGISLEGKLPKELSDKDIPDEEWLSVFKCLHKKNTKLFLNHVRDEFVDEFGLLYQKVYQATPSNGELLAKFAQGFVYERCPVATSDPIGHRIAWARFDGSVLENCKMQKGGLERKINKFRTDYGLTGVIQIEASICDGALSSIPTMSTSKLQPFQAVETPMYIQLVLSMAGELSDQENEQKRLLGEVKLQLQEKRDLCLKNEGHFSTYNDFYRELDQLNKELEVLNTSLNSDPREVDRKEIEQRNIALEFELEVLTSQRAFMDTAVQYIEEKGRGIIVPSSPTKASILNPFVCIGGDCVAFLCGTMAECTYPLCTVKILEITKCWELEYTEPGETNADKSSHVPELDENITELLELDESNIELSEGFQHGKAAVKSGDRMEDPKAEPFVVENHGKETIGLDSSKLSTDNQEGSLETADKVEDAEDVET
ncbi:hypothetical protein L7F22_004068 [Adiantum nelumboides]|nr:hypothetical protein [Adiantum nelumboides]